MNVKLLGSVLIALTLLSCLGACEDAKAKKTITIVDGKGQSVNVSAPVDKIVTITSRASEIICALGSGDKIVGRDSYSFFPASLNDVPVVAESSYKPDIELIAKIDPDLVVADNMLSSDDRKKIESAGIPVIVEAALDPTTIATFVNHLGILLDKEDRAGEIIRFIKTYQDIVDERVAGLKESERPAVFIEFGTPYHAMGNGTIFHNMTVAAGGMNIAVNQPIQYPTLSPEWVAKRDPDIIFSYAATKVGENLTENMKTIRDEITSRSALKNTKAVKGGRVYVLGNPVAWGIRSVVGELYLAKWFHPDLFNDIDPEAVHRELLKKFFGQELDEVCVYP